MEFKIDDLQKINFMVNGNFDIINATSNLKFNSVLDIGFGEGGASAYFALNGKNVTALGLNIESYHYPKVLFNKLDVKIVESTIEDFESDTKFDAIWASHVLEHLLNVGLFLEKCKELLNDDGWLFIMVPPHKNQVVGGHVNNGWNMGQLMYNLLLTGYDIKGGHFINHGYNICAFVQKSKEKLPQIRMDIGDIETTKDFWPIEVKQGFDGNIDKVNWFECFKQYEDERNTILIQKDELLSKDTILQEKNSLISSQLTELESKDKLLGEKEDEISSQKKELENKEKILQEKENQISKQKKELVNKKKILQENADKISNQQNELENKDKILQEKEDEISIQLAKIFSSDEINLIFNELKPEVLKLREGLPSSDKINEIKCKTSFQYHLEEKFIDLMKPIKKTPYLGKSLVWFKREVIKWDL